MRTLLAAIVIAAGAPHDVIRVGGPSAPSDPKVAVVGSARDLAGKPFTVTGAGGRVVLRGRLRKAPGSPGPFRHAATATLSRISKPGRYVVRAAGRRSRAWVVQGDARSRAVRRLLRIYAVNADGNEPNPVYGPAHLKDAIVKGGRYDGQRMDLTGGWRDAGDHLKFTQTTALAVSYLHLAARLDPADAAMLRTTAGTGVRWLLKAHPKPDLFVALVGDERDHTTDFRNPAGDDANTKAGVGIRYAYPSVSSEILGQAAAALALAGQVPAAKEWYEQALRTNAKIPIDDPNVGDFYPEDAYLDDLAFAADALWRATGERHYLDETAALLRAGSRDQLFGGIVVGASRPLVAADLCGALGAPAAPDAAIRALGCEDVRATMDAIRQRVHARAFGSPGIFTFGWVQDNGGAGALAASAGRAGLAADGRSIAAGARDYMRGRNQWGASFVVGPAAYEAHNPHHAAYLNGKPSRLLDGAVVGGPAKAGDITGAGLAAARNRFNGAGLAYEDKRSDYVTSEVGLAYSSAALLLAASLG